MNDNIYEKQIIDFISRSNEKILFVEYISKKFNTKIISSVLSIGVGDGEMDIIIKQKLGTNVYDVVEPNKNYINNLKKHFTNVYDRFIEEIEFKTKYDLIILSHVLYYVKDLPYLIQKLYKIGSNILIYNQTISTFTYVIQSIILSGKHSLTSFDIKECLNSLNISHEDNIISCKINIENISDQCLEFIANKKLNDNELYLIKNFLNEQSMEYRISQRNYIDLEN